MESNQVILFFVETNLNFKFYCLKVSVRLTKAFYLKLPKEQKTSKKQTLECYPLISALYGSPGRGLVKQKSVYWGGYGRGEPGRQRIERKLIARINAAIWCWQNSLQGQALGCFIGSSYLAPTVWSYFFSALPIRAAEEGLAVPLTHWQKLLRDLYGAEVPGVLSHRLNYLSSRELASLHSLLQWVLPEVQKPRSLWDLCSFLAVPEKYDRNFFDLYSLMVQEQLLKQKGLGLFAFLKTLAGDKYCQYFYETQHGMIMDDNQILDIFHGGYRLLGFKFYNTISQNLRILQLMGQGYVVGTALTTGLEMEKFRGLMVSGVLPKSNSKIHQLSLEQIAFLALVLGSNLITNPKACTSQLR
jgi:hypothetical protein